MDKIKDKIIKITADQLGCDLSKIDETSRFVDDLGADSLDTLELAMAFEDEFDQKISEDQIKQIQTVGDAVKFISNKVGETG